MDDEPAALDTIRTLCVGHHVETETVPFKAIERMYNEDFDIFLVDYKMPYTTGIELLERIKKLQVHEEAREYFLHHLLV